MSATSTTDLLKMLSMAAVTVMGSYLSITAHIDSAVTDKVHEAMLVQGLRLERCYQYADSLHHAQAQEIRALQTETQKAALPRKRQ